MSKRRHNFGKKRFKEKSLFIFHARIALKSLILLFVCLIARGARIGKTHTQTDTHNKYCNPRCACTLRVNNALPPYNPTTWHASGRVLRCCTCVWHSRGLVACSNSQTLSSQPPQLGQRLPEYL